MAIMGLQQMAFIRTGGTGHGRCPPDMTLTTALLAPSPVTKSRYYGDEKILQFMDQPRNVHYDFGRMQQQN